jgi:hypothetical protein
MPIESRDVKMQQRQYQRTISCFHFFLVTEVPEVQARSQIDRPNMSVARDALNSHTLEILHCLDEMVLVVVPCPRMLATMFPPKLPVHFQT